MKNLKWKIGIGVAIWIAILAYMIVPQQILISFPESYPRIILETNPVDPRDFLRGDYVILDYEISRPSSIDNEKISAEYKTLLEATKAGATLYLSLDLDSEGRAKLTAISEKKPTTGIFLRGKVKKTLRGESHVAFGIEKYFVPEGRGRTLEKLRNQKKLEVEVAVHPEKGKSLITNLLVDGEIVDNLAILDDEINNGIFDRTPTEYVGFYSNRGVLSLQDEDYDFLQNLNRADRDNLKTLRFKFNQNQGILEVWDEKLLEEVDLTDYLESLIETHKSVDNSIPATDFVYTGETVKVRFKIFFDSLSGNYKKDQEDKPQNLQITGLDGIILFSAK